ncbi:MAG: transcriptional repressor LexA [Pseudomonadota bacterium]
MRPLTERQMQVLSLVCRTIHDDGMPPTRAEIANALGFASANAAEDHLKALAKKGMIEKIPGNSRGIVITPLAREHCPDCSGFGDVASGLPVIGRVAAGAPIESHEHIDDFHRVDPHLFSPRADYLLRVQGDSMRDVGILDGDLLAVHRTHEAHNGQIVVARVDHDEVTVKRFQKRGNTVHLIAENPDYEPIKVDLREQHLSIEGLYAGVLRVAG